MDGWGRENSKTLTDAVWFLIAIFGEDGLVIYFGSLVFGFVRALRIAESPYLTRLGGLEWLLSYRPSVLFQFLLLLLF